jgi:hypothetical protein
MSIDFPYVITASLGDSDLLRKMPGPLAKLGRAISVKLPGGVAKRLHETYLQIFPVLRAVEAKIYQPADQILQKHTAQSAHQSDVALERAILCLEAGWRAGLINIISLQQEPVPYGDRWEVFAPAGINMGLLSRYLFDMIGQALFSDRLDVYDSLGIVPRNDLELDRLRRLAGLSTPHLNTLRKVFGKNMRTGLFSLPADRLEAVFKLQAFQLARINEFTRGRLDDFLNRDAEFIDAVATHLHTDAHFVDLQHDFMSIQSVEMVEALGSMELRDASEKANEERRTRGLGPVTEPVYETDIGVLRKIFEQYFSELLQQPPSMLFAMGRMLPGLRKLKPAERSKRIEEIRTFAKHYLKFMTPEIVEALGMTAEDDGESGNSPTFTEGLQILEGLWFKQGLGRQFIEGHLRSEQGLKALKATVNEYLSMKRKGAIKPGSDVKAILTNSDILDGYIQPFIRQPEL